MKFIQEQGRKWSEVACIGAGRPSMRSLGRAGFFSADGCKLCLFGLA
jgi:hypothetical protein